MYALYSCTNKYIPMQNPTPYPLLFIFNTACEHREHASATSFGYDRSRAALLEGAPAMTSHITPMQVVALGIPSIRGDSGTT